VTFEKGLRLFADLLKYSPSCVNPANNKCSQGDKSDKALLINLDLGVSVSSECCGTPNKEEGANTFCSSGSRCNTDFSGPFWSEFPTPSQFLNPGQGVELSRLPRVSLVKATQGIIIFIGFLSLWRLCSRLAYFLT
jgi:hypothetical protein